MSSANLNNTFLLSINSAKHNARQTYIFDIIFKEIIGIDYEFVSEKDQAMLAYGTTNGSVIYDAHPLIYADSLSTIELESVIWNKKKFPFKVDSESSALPFDPFSACFYFISRLSLIHI